MPDLVLVLIVILALVLMWRGPKTLPKLGEALGRGVREAKTEATKAQAEIQARASGEPTDAADTTPSATDESRPT
jgi:Sec-independent protein translocase protein TatA